MRSPSFSDIVADLVADGTDLLELNDTAVAPLISATVNDGDRRRAERGTLTATVLA